MNIKELKEKYGSDKVTVTRTIHGLNVTTLDVRIRVADKALEDYGFRPVAYAGIGFSHYLKSFKVVEDTLEQFCTNTWAS